jgi:small GTP-binding protein
MSAPSTASTVRLPLVVVAGNPNTGKTTVFNRLTGSDQKVANYPGVTVEQSTATLELGNGTVANVLDVPGTYSLSARSREEELAIQTIAGLAPFERPDLVVVVADATQLSRNLYMTLQILELGVPVVLAVNMADMIEARGDVLDLVALRRELGIPVVPTCALQGRGLDELRREIAATLADPGRARPGWRWKPEDPALEAGHPPRRARAARRLGRGRPRAGDRGVVAPLARREGRDRGRARIRAPGRRGRAPGGGRSRPADRFGGHPRPLRLDRRAHAGVREAARRAGDRGAGAALLHGPARRRPAPPGDGLRDLPARHGDRVPVALQLGGPGDPRRRGALRLASRPERARGCPAGSSRTSSRAA